MSHGLDILMLLAAAAVGVALILLVRWRRRDYARNMRQMAGQEVCDHLRPAYETLVSRGHTAVRVGQKNPDFPFEIHMTPPPGAAPFDPRQLFDELKLAEPVFVSERDV